MATVLDSYIHFRVNPRDRRRLQRIARHYERGASSALRMLIAREDARLARAKKKEGNGHG